MPTRALGPRLVLLATAALFSTGGAAIKACALPGAQVAGLRSGIAAVALAALLPAARRRPTAPALLVAVVYAATLTCFVRANKLTTSANAIFIQSTAPLYVLLLGPWLLRERVRLRDLLFMGALAAGLGAFFLGVEPATTTAPDPLAGNLWAAASGVFWALTIVGLRHVARAPGGGAAPALVAGNGLAFAAALPAGLPAGATAADWLVLLYLGVFQIGLAYVLMQRAMRAVPALEASLLLLVEPVLNPVWSWLVHGERPGPWALAGGALILAATAVKSTADALRPADATAGGAADQGGRRT